MNCKLTDENGQTRNGTQWGPGVTHTATGALGQPLCSDGWIHFYESPEMAAFMNPAHGDFRRPQLWSVSAEPEIRDGELKCGARTVTTVERIPLPEITTKQRVEIAIRLVLCVYKEPKFVVWAEKWLSGEDRTARAARETEAVWAAAAKAAVAAVWAAEAEAEAAAVWAAEAAVWAAEAAAWAAEAAAKAENNQPFILALIRQVLEHEGIQNKGKTNG